MSKQNYTWEEIKDKINKEYDIAVLTDEIFEKKLYHPNVPINKFLLDGSLDFSFDVKDNRTNMICPLHDTKNDDSTYSYHEGTTANQMTCKVGDCRTNGISLTPINLYMVLVKNVSPDLLFDSVDEYKEAVKELAEMHGIEGWSYGTRQLTEEELKEMRKQRIRQEVAEIYYNQFMKKNDWARKAREFFFYERGFGQLGFKIRRLIRKHKIGYAGGKYGSKFIYNILKKKYTDEELLYAGVVQYKKTYDKKLGKKVNTTEIIDFLTNRLTIPYHKSASKIDHGYGRRIEFKAELEKLYEKMTEEEIKNHKKGKHLRFKGGVDQPINFQEAKKYESIIIVEGEMDWLTFLALNFPNTIAVGGTNGLEKDDINLLKYQREKSERKQCNTIYFCFDEDGPGQTAMMKLGKTLVAEGFDVRMVRLVEGDPNDYLKIYGEKAKEKLSELLENAVSFSAFSILFELKKSILKTHADVNGFLVKVKHHLDDVHPLQRIAIAGDVLEGINTFLPKEKQYKMEWILYAWGVIPMEKSLPDAERVTEPAMEGFERAIQKHWVLITDKKERYDAVLKCGVMDNIVFTRDISSFIDKIKEIEHVKTIAFDMAVENEDKRTLLLELSDYNFQAFTAPTVESIEEASKYEFIAFFRKYELPNKKIG